MAHRTTIANLRSRIRILEDHIYLAYHPLILARIVELFPGTKENNKATIIYTALETKNLKESRYK